MACISAQTGVFGGDRAVFVRQHGLFVAAESLDAAVRLAGLAEEVARLYAENEGMRAMMSAATCRKLRTLMNGYGQQKK